MVESNQENIRGLRNTYYLKKHILPKLSLRRNFLRNLFPSPDHIKYQKMKARFIKGLWSGIKKDVHMHVPTSYAATLKKAFVVEQSNGRLYGNT